MINQLVILKNVDYFAIVWVMIIWCEPSDWACGTWAGYYRGLSSNVNASRLTSPDYAERHLKTIEFAWSRLKLSEVPWSSMKFNEVAWNFLKFPELPWSSLKFPEVPWSRLKLSEVPWSFLKSPEVAWSRLKSPASLPFWALHFTTDLKNPSQTSAYQTPNIQAVSSNLDKWQK